MSQPFLAEIRIFSFNFAPNGWALCAGQLLSIAQNQALFSLLGTTYGGNGINNFALPDLRGRAPIHVSANDPEGSRSGEENHTLLISEIPLHTHNVAGSSASATLPTPGGNIWGDTTQNPYSAAASNGAMNPASIGLGGGSQPHSNMQPYLVLNFCIALTGIFPSRN